ncbi:hypothetical protein Tco_0394633 [Tanacetum coccineum]
MDSENDNEKVNLPSLPSPESAISCFDDLDFFKDFENEFPSIVYNDAQTSKSDLLTESILSSQHIDEFDLNDKTSFSEYDEEEQNVSTVYTAYSLNEYSVYDTGINMTYPGEVVKNGNKVLKRTIGTVEQEYEPTIAEEKLDRKECRYALFRMELDTEERMGG